jgi:rod shape determining protein RodA
MLFVAFLPNRLYYDFAYVVYAISIILLILVFVIGTTGLGATRWLRFGSVGIQPSEIAKIATLLALARYLSDEHLEINRPKVFIIASTMVIVPFALIARQPDLGTALVFVVLVLPIFYWVGLKTATLILILIPVIVLFASFNTVTFIVTLLLILLYLIYLKPSLISGSAYFFLNIVTGFITPMLWNQLKDYQKQRITTFWNPEADPLGAGYQIIQSKVAIGSGGFFGKGFLQGSQTQLRYLPEQHTDFIYAVIGEEFGFVGVFIGLVLFAVLLFRIIYIANLCKSLFSSTIAIGIGTIIGFHMFINIGMTIGLFPVTGLPLPFISYGGSALITNMTMAGLLLNFYRSRYEY